MSSVSGYKNGTGLYLKRNILIQVNNDFQSIQFKHKKFVSLICAFLVASGNDYLWIASPNEVINMSAYMNNWLIIRTQGKRWLSLLPSPTEKKKAKDDYPNSPPPPKKKPQAVCFTDRAQPSVEPTLNLGYNS